MKRSSIDGLHFTRASIFCHPQPRHDSEHAGSTMK